MNPKISMITVCFNSEKTIDKTIQHVLNQTYKNIEYVIVDGLSIDRTMEIIKSYEKAFGGRLKYISEKDYGIYDAMNKGIKMCTGDIIGITNSDDWLELDALENVAAAYDSNAKGQVIYGMVANMVKGQPSIYLMPTDYGMELGGNPMHHPGCFISKSAYDAVGLYDTEFCIAADFDLLMRCKKTEGIVFTPVHSLLANFSCDEGVSSKNMLQTNMEHLKVRHKFNMVDDKSYNKMMFKMKLKKRLGQK